MFHISGIGKSAEISNWLYPEDEPAQLLCIFCKYQDANVSGTDVSGEYAAEQMEQYQTE